MPSRDPLAQRVIQGDYDAFDQLVDRYKDGVYRISVLLLGSIHDGLDAAEESFVRSYRTLQSTDDGALPFITIYRQAVHAATALRKRMEIEGFLVKRQADGEVLDPLAILSSFDTVDAQILTLYDVEDLVPEDVAAILALPVDHIRETLSRTRESEQTAPLSGAITELRKLKAPPGFSMAIRDCLAIEADYLRSRVARKRLIRSIVIALLIAGTVAGSWSIYRHFTDRPQRSMLPSSVDEPTNTFPTPPQETTPYRKPDTAPKTPTSPALHEKGVNATPSPPRQPNPQAIEETAPAASIPTILLSRPKNPVSSLEDIVAYVHPKLKVPPQRQGETWIVAVNEDQFWNMYRWLKAFYSDMRIPERAIPKGEEQRRIKFKQVDFIPRPTQGPTHPNN